MADEIYEGAIGIDLGNSWADAKLWSLKHY